MNVMRTAMLLAAMTALFMMLGYLIGGSQGMVVALVVAAAMNLFSYWNSDKIVLRMHGAREVDARTAPELHAMVARLADERGPADAEGSTSSRTRSPTPSPPGATPTTPPSPSRAASSRRSATTSSPASSRTSSPTSATATRSS